MELVSTPEVSVALDAMHGRVAALYVPEVAPLFCAPDEFNRAWVGVPVPVRTEHLGEHVSRISSRSSEPIIELLNGRTRVVITGADGIRALLEADRPRAAGYWMRQILTTTVSFSTREGTLRPFERG